jgi:hypothetical protein
LELGPDGIQAAISEATATFKHRYKADFSGAERYWEQSIVLADLAGRLATEWGLIKFDHTKGIEWVLSQIGAIRRTVADYKVDAFDLLTEYMNDTASAQVQVFHNGTQKPTMDYNRVPRGEIRVRFDFYRKDVGGPVTTGTVLLDKSHFRRWLSSKGADYKSFMQEIDEQQLNVTPKSSKAYLGKDTPIKLGQSYVIGINLNNPRTIGMLTDADDAIDNLTLGQLKVVT